MPRRLIGNLSAGTKGFALPLPNQSFFKEKSGSGNKKFLCGIISLFIL
jgi:hypothetical protein